MWFVWRQWNKNGREVNNASYYMGSKMDATTGTTLQIRLHARAADGGSELMFPFECFFEVLDE